MIGTHARKSATHEGCAEQRPIAAFRIGKRLFDVLASALALVVLSPLFLVISLLLLRQKNGSVFFRQERIGKGGKSFIIYKFRTISSQIEEDGPKLVARSDDGNATPLEQFLRNHHLDELPQLWNVLRGDMSIVGPRPERAYFIRQIMAVRPDYAELYALRPGLTSEATIKNGYTDTLEKMITRLDMDLDYLHHQSMCRDFKIILDTFSCLFSSKN